VKDPREKSYINAREAHKDGWTWASVSLIPAKKTESEFTLKLVGALEPKAAKVIEHIMFGDLDDADACLAEMRAARASRGRKGRSS
jgi:hypothetical protein